MKKKIFVLGLSALLLCGCGKTIPTLENGQQAIVTFKDGKQISVDELYNEMKSDYAFSNLMNMVDKYVLETEYSNNLEEAKKYSDNVMASLKESYGDELLSTIQSYTGYTSLEAYQNYITMSYLNDLAVTDYAKSQITEKEMKKYYESDVVGDIKVSHILITSGATSDSTTDEKTKLEDAAKEKINNIINELNNVSSDKVEEKFSELAKEYSEDDATKENGGSLGFINKGTLSDSYDELVDAAYKLKDGEYSKEIITTELGYHVILRLETKDKAAYEDVKDTIITTLADKLKTDDSTIAIKAMQELRKKYDMDIIDSDLQTNYAAYIQNALTAATSSTSSSN